jgi:hypothetical protein
MKLKSLVALATLFAASAASATAFNGSVAAGAFNIPVNSFSISAGQKAMVSFGVGSSPVDITVPVTPTLNLPVHFDALTFTLASVDNTVSPISFTDNDLSNGALFTVMAPGGYVLSFSGTSTTGGFYAGNYSVAISAVPEPESLALLLAGVGITSVIARRRRG